LKNYNAQKFIKHLKLWKHIPADNVWNEEVPLISTLKEDKKNEGFLIVSVLFVFVKT